MVLWQNIVVIFSPFKRVLANSAFMNGPSCYISKKRAQSIGLIGIKNSWKYEKDLMIIFNGISVVFTITQVGNMQKPLR